MEPDILIKNYWVKKWCWVIKHLKISIHGSTVYKAGSGDIKLKARLMSQSIIHKSTHIVCCMNVLMHAYTSTEKGGPCNLHFKEDEKVLPQKNYKQGIGSDLSFWNAPLVPIGEIGEWVGEEEDWGIDWNPNQHNHV